jgi:TonB family protein
LNRSVCGRWCALSAYLVMGIAWSAQAVDTVAIPPSAETDTVSLLQGWDREQIEMRELVWRTYAPTAVLDKDSRGRTVANDLNDWVMTKDVQDRLSSLRAAAERQLRAGDDHGARQTLESGRAAVEEQRRVLSLVNYYWTQRFALNRQRDLWLAWLRLSPDAVNAQSKHWIDPLEATLTRNLSPATTQDALAKQVESLKRAYNEERIKLAELISDRRLAEGKVVAARERRMACAASPQHIDRRREGVVATGDQPVAIAIDMSPGRLYPEAARRNGISGSVDLRLTIGTTGCMERAEVLRSSGAEELDEAAIDLSEYVHYFPAKRGGQPIRAAYTRTIAFQSEDAIAAQSGPNKVPTTAAAYVTRGNNRLNHGEYDLAIADFEKAIDMDPTAAMGFADRGMAYIWKRQYELARKDLDAAYALDPRNPVVFRGRGMLAVDADDLGGAIEAFTTSLEIEPHNVFSLQHRAAALLLAGEQDKALAGYAEAIQLQPSSLLSYAARSGIFRAQGKIELSVGEAESLIAANPTDAHAFMTAGAIDAASGKNSQAMRAFDRAVEIFPDEATYLFRAVYRSHTDLAGERADIDAAMKLNPQSISASISLAKMQSDARDYAGALATLGVVIAIQTGNYDLLTERGIVYAKSGQPALAERDFAAARAIATGATALNSICWRKATAGVALDTALAECDAAVAEARNQPAIIDSRGFVLLRLARYEEAIACYDSALRIRPFSADSLYGRGLAKRRHGQSEEASADIGKALLVDAHVAERFADYGLAE